jgi:intracellular sulfur oxidation DsrE/DsrF family protein
MQLSRKMFVASAAAATAASLSAPSRATEAASATPATVVHFHILKPNEFDHAMVMQTLTGTAKNKQIFQASEARILAPRVSSLYLHMANSMNAFQFSYPSGVGPLSTAGVLMAPTMVLALKDTMWKKYNLGKAFNLPSTNEFYNATSKMDLSASPDDPNGIYQDWSAQALLKRGATFFVCHNATTAVAAMVAEKSAASIPVVLSDFEKNLLPGFTFVPAGVATVQLAIENGWGLFQV